MFFQKKSDGFVRFVAAIVCIVWGLWVLLICAIVIVDVFYEKPTVIDEYIMYLIGFDFAFNVFAFILFQFPECKSCRKKVFEETAHVKKNANYWTFVNGWSAVVVQIVTKNQFVCMHCGKIISLKKNESKE